MIPHVVLSPLTILCLAFVVDASPGSWTDITDITGLIRTDVEAAACGRDAGRRRPCPYICVYVLAGPSGICLAVCASRFELTAKPGGSFTHARSPLPPDGSQAAVGSTCTCESGTAAVQSSTRATGTFPDGSVFEATLSGGTATIINSNAGGTCAVPYSAVFRPWWAGVSGGLSVVAWLILVCFAAVVGGGYACNAKRNSRINAALRRDYMHEARLMTSPNRDRSPSSVVHSIHGGSE